MREESLLGGGQRRIDAQHSRGKLTATRADRPAPRQRDLSKNWIRSSFTGATDFGLADQHYLGDAVVTGYGQVDGRLVFVYAQDFTVLGGSLSEAVAQKICKVMDLSMYDRGTGSGTDRFRWRSHPRRRVDSLAGYSSIFHKNVWASGVVPQISVILGPAAGGATYSPALTDFIFMASGVGQMYITGPDVIRSVTGEDVSHEDLGRRKRPRISKWRGALCG